MSQKKIEKLTPEQEALIPVYRDKWRKIALSTEPIDREKAAEAVKQAYKLIGLPEPKFIFYESPKAALNTVIQYFEEQLENSSIEKNAERLYYQFVRYLYKQITNQIEEELGRSIWSELEEQLEQILEFQFYNPLFQQIHNEPNLEIDFIEANIWEVWGCGGALYEFGISVLNCVYDKMIWEIFQSISKNCGCFVPCDNTCIICDRPRILSFDNQQRLHAEGAPAIQFADGYSLYAYHGVTLPKKYGNIPPNYWPASWLLKEENAELRRVLIQAIGYEKIASELGATELDSFREYRLLKINTDVDIEPIYMLKMICPSTGHIHVLRVPPDLKSAREAIRWVNWGVDTEEFGVQT
ncbi:DUF6745 domain-containing protein [Aerosakkonema sp. BLCC-F183]|uniref:DUF6745 domain-containing protein n=1 Tax=Aerosakkonema sp. BLCC-F183 TaxID=3342834 RepID=UPI0035B8FF48